MKKLFFYNFVTLGQSFFFADLALRYNTEKLNPKKNSGSRLKKITELIDLESFRLIFFSSSMYC